MSKRKGAKGKGAGKDAERGVNPLHTQQDTTAGVLPELKVSKQVQTVWDNASELQRTKLLSFDIRLLYARAAYVKDQPGLTNDLTRACELLQTDGSCKRWCWQPNGPAFDHPASLMRYMEDKVFPASLEPCLKHPKVKAALSNSRAAVPGSTQALHQRLREIQKEVATFKLSQQELCKDKPWTVVRESGILDLICQKLIDEHEFLHNAFAAPIQYWLWSLKPITLRGPEPHSDVCFEAVMFQLIDSEAVGIPDSVSQVTKWAEQKLADFVRLTSQETGVDFRRFEPLDNVIDGHGNRVVVQKQWRDAVQCHYERCPLPTHVTSAPQQISWSMLEEDAQGNPAFGVGVSSSPAAQFASAAGSAAGRPARCSPVLQWIYGGEPKPFEALQLPGSGARPTVASRAYSQLLRTLQDTKIRVKEVDQLEKMTRDLVRRREEMKPWSNIRRDPSNPQQQLPPEALTCILRQEHTVTEARLLLNVGQSHRLARELFKTTQRIIQVEAELEHLESVEKAIDRDARALHSNDEFASQHHKDWVAEQMRAELASKAKAKSKALCHLKALCKEKEVSDRVARRNEEEFSSINAWLQQMDDLIKALNDLMAGLEIQAATPGPWLGTGINHQQLKYVKSHFHEDIWPKLSSSTIILNVFKELQKQHKEMGQLLEQGCAILGPLMALLLEAACDDPTVPLLSHLVFPLIRERLEAHATKSQDFALAKSSVNCFGEPNWDATFSELTQRYQQQVFTSPATVDQAIYKASIDLMAFKEDVECGGNERRMADQGWLCSLFIDDVCLKNHSRKDIDDSEFPHLLEITKLYCLEPTGAQLILLHCIFV